MNYRVLMLFVAGLFLSACGDDEATTQANAPPEPEESAFFDPAEGGDIVVGEDGQIVKIPEEETSEWARSPTGTMHESSVIDPSEVGHNVAGEDGQLVKIQEEEGSE
jgi:hypothetical protein